MGNFGFLAAHEDKKSSSDIRLQNFSILNYVSNYVKKTMCPIRDKFMDWFNIIK